jgi:hypothetical protein
MRQLGEALWDLDAHNMHKTMAKRFHVLGGEPFYQIQFNRCLDFFDN